MYKADWQVCPMIWRMYSYYTEDERQAVQEQHSAAKGWAKEAVGGREHERWCYNCAQVRVTIEHSFCANQAGRTFRR
jgi:hypothetical protein